MRLMAGKYWWKEAKIYELYIDKFAGTIQNLTAQLDYFTKLGINTLHILPHYPSPMIDDGYDVMDYCSVRPELGTLEDFENLVKAAHARGIRIIVDFVLNHVSDQHPWFLEARSSKKNPRRDYFLWHENDRRFTESWNAFQGIKESNWIYNEATNDFYYATFYPAQPDLNWDNPDVVSGMMAYMDFWADHGVDGFRLDAVLTLIKRDGTISKGLPETHAIIRKIRAHLDTKYGGNIILLAESHMEVEEIKTFFGNGDECHMAYHFPLMEALYLHLLLDEPARVEEVLEKSKDIPANCTWATFLRNHDEISLATLPLIRRTTLVSQLDPEGEYLFNRGQATAVRLANIFDGKPEKLREAITLLYSLPGSPIMYYGDEIMMRNLPREEGVADTRRFVRGPFDWEEAAREDANPDSLLAFVRKTIHTSRALHR